MRTNTLFIISGPSGAGEDSIINGLSAHIPIERVITTTTRAPRDGETNGNPYYFVSLATFRDGIARKKFVEYAEEYNGHYYGVTTDELERVASSGKVGIWKIEYKGVITAKKLFPSIVAIFIMAPSISVLEQRIRRRDTASEAYIRERMNYTKEWLTHTDIYDHTVINHEGKLEEAITKTVAIIRSHLPSSFHP